MRNRIKYSQNFLISSELVKSLVNKSSLFHTDTVFEIGAGEGIITEQLLEKAGKVVAFGLDRNFFNKLRQKFHNEKSLELKWEDFLKSNLPDGAYKVFSNVPFNITSAVIKKLTLEDNSPEDAYLIIQKEAAAKFAGRPLDTKNSQLAVILNPWFELNVIHNFNPGDFFPKPNVDIVLLEIKKRNEPLIGNENKNKYRDFVTYAFSKYPKPSIVNFKKWVGLFNQFLNKPEKEQFAARGSFAKQLRQQENLEKINRTRVDKNWRKTPRN